MGGGSGGGGGGGHIISDAAKPSTSDSAMSTATNSTRRRLIDWLPQGGRFSPGDEKREETRRERRRDYSVQRNNNNITRPWQVVSRSALPALPCLASSASKTTSRQDKTKQRVWPTASSAAATAGIRLKLLASLNLRNLLNPLICLSVFCLLPSSSVRLLRPEPHQPRSPGTQISDPPHTLCPVPGARTLPLPLLSNCSCFTACTIPPCVFLDHSQHAVSSRRDVGQDVFPEAC